MQNLWAYEGYVHLNHTLLEEKKKQGVLFTIGAVKKFLIAYMIRLKINKCKLMGQKVLNEQGKFETSG